MTQTLLDDHRKWRDELIYHLRMKDVPGDRIGDILLESESHIRQTGETPQEAFGDAREYAEAHIALNPRIRANRTSVGRLIGIGLLSFAGATLYASGILGIGQEADAIFGLNAWLAFLAGVAILLVGLLRLPGDLIRHPDTDAPLFGGMTKLKAATAVVLAVVGVILFFLGRALA